MGLMNISVGDQIGVTAVFVTMSTWGMHIIHCIDNQDWIMLAAGAIVAPIGMINGCGLILGWW